MVDLKTQIEQKLFIKGAFCRRRAASAANAQFIKELEAIVGKHRSISETVFLALGGFKNTCDCGTDTAYISFAKGYRKFCCTKCMSQSASVKSKRVTSIEKTCIEKYGVTNALGVESIRTKAKKTMVRRYGVENFSQHSLHKDLVAATSIKKFGVDHPLKAASVKEKIKVTMKKKYGGFTAESDVLKPKMRMTMVERYGAQTSWESDSLLPKLHAWQRDRFLSKVAREFKVLNIGEKILLEHSCGHQFNIELFNKPQCPACKEASTPEKEVYLFLHALGVNVKRNDRSILSGKELDLVLPDHKIAIEVNGAWWHHAGTDKVTLASKSKMAKEAGFQLIHIWDFEWHEKQHIIKSMIRAKLGLLDKIYARKCKVVQLKTSVARDFLNTYHLQGSCRSTIKIGLEYDAVLVAVATFGPARFKGQGTELLRMAFLDTVQVLGGVSKLLSAVDGELMTYTDLRYGTGAGYEKAGMTADGVTSPGYCWFSRGVVLGRYETQKSKLPLLLGDKFDPMGTENSNMQSAGFLKLVDCGHARFRRE